jgi:putative nucleotidyltransferase with HDIG domain
VSGTEVLAMSRKTQPQALRFVLSGRADRAVASDAKAAHQIFGKPADLEELLTRAKLVLGLKPLLTPAEIDRVTSGDGIPRSPKVFAALRSKLRSEDYEPKAAAGIVEQDISLTGRVLQVASASPLGPRRRVTSVRSALVALGRDAVEQLVLLEEVLSSAASGASIQLRDHALQCAKVAMALEPAADGAFIAGVLHDIGRVLQDEADRPKGRHAALGAYLVALWGFPEALIEAVLHHHELPPPGGPDVRTAIYVAERIVNEGIGVLEDPALLERYGTSTIDRWHQSVLSRGPIDPLHAGSAPVGARTEG